MPKKELRFTQDESAAKTEIEQTGGRIIHQFSSTTFVAELPDSVDLDALNASTPHPTEELDEGTQLAVDAWNSEQTAEAPSATEGLEWDSPGFQNPRHPGNDEDLSAQADDFLPGDNADGPESDAPTIDRSTGTPTSLKLIGSVAVGIVLVSRDQGDETMSRGERLKIVQEVQDGLDWLLSVEPRARVSFNYDVQPVTVSAAPGPDSTVSNPYEKMERGWRDAALHEMGYQGGRSGYRQYVRDLRSSRNTDWAYVAFFTKYPLQHFAYTMYEKVVMNYGNDGWGPDDIHRVFAHESCHIFGAADEYGSCSCDGRYGQLNVPNNNCTNCFPPGTQESCLMDHNQLDLCKWSRLQIGWDRSSFVFNKVVLDNTSPMSPALTQHGQGSQLCMAWTGTDPDYHLNIMSSSDGTTWDNKVTLGDTSVAGPALAADNHASYLLAWAGTDPNHHLNVMSSSDGATWGNKVTLGDASSMKPSLTFHNGRWYLAWTGTGPDHHINIMSSSDGTTWGDKVTLRDTSIAGPALASDGNKLYLAWAGTDSSHHLNVISSHDGASWNNKRVFNETTPFAPALTYNGTQISLSWTGTDGNHHLNEMYSTDGINWDNKMTLNDTSIAGPALATRSDNTVLLGFAGRDQDHHLNVEAISE